MMKSDQKHTDIKKSPSAYTLNKSCNFTSIR